MSESHLTLISSRYRDMPDVRSNAEATDKIEYYFVHLFKTVSNVFYYPSDVRRGEYYCQNMKIIAL